MAKRIMNPTKEPAFPRMFPLDKITVLQAQFFDNRKRADGKKGQSDYSLKLFAWNRMNNITLMADADWWRILQLLEPHVVAKWAKAKFAAGGMTADQYQLYTDVVEQAEEFIASGDHEMVRIGHIGSPPGKQYHIGQFAIVFKSPEEPVQAILFVDGTPMVLDQFKPTRSRGTYRKPGSALYAMIHDPEGFIGQSKDSSAGLPPIRKTKVDPVQARLEHGLTVSPEEMFERFVKGEA